MRSQRRGKKLLKPRKESRRAKSPISFSYECDPLKTSISRVTPFHHDLIKKYNKSRSNTNVNFLFVFKSTLRLPSHPSGLDAQLLAFSAYFFAAVLLFFPVSYAFFSARALICRSSLALTNSSITIASLLSSKHPSNSSWKYSSIALRSLFWWGWRFLTCVR